MKRVALLGPGTFSDESAQHFMGNGNYEFMNYKLISDVFMSTANGESDYCVVPIENTIEGSVSLHHDWMVHEVDLPIQAEWIYPIDINLIVAKQGAGTTDGNPFGHIQKVYSHPVALAQCRKFLRDHLPHAEIEQMSSTAESVRWVKQLDDPAVASIGPMFAAQLHQALVIARSIQDNPDNYTRFQVLGRKPLNLGASSTKKTTLIITAPEDYPGALHQILSALAWRRINLTRIESRPTKKKLGTYYFYMEIEGSFDSVLLTAAVQEIEALGCQVRLLGSYPSYLHQFDA